MTFFSKYNPFKKATTYSWISAISLKVSRLINENSILKSKIDQLGILNGNEIVEGFMNHKEYNLALEHLIYMIIESGVFLNQLDIDNINSKAKDLKVDTQGVNSPTELEIDEFYRIVDLFNNAQNTVVERLKEIWSLAIPIKDNEWVVWSQNQNDKDSFQNELNVQIFPHGYGLNYKDEKLLIDFDFGSKGEYCGFDSYRIWQFTRKNKLETMFVCEEQISRLVKHQLNQGKLTFSGYLNYYKLSELEKFNTRHNYKT